MVRDNHFIDKMEKTIIIKYYSKKTNGTAFTKSGIKIEDDIIKGDTFNRVDYNMKKRLNYLGLNMTEEADFRGNIICASEGDLMCKIIKEKENLKQITHKELMVAKGKYQCVDCGKYRCGNPFVGYSVRCEKCKNEK